MAFKDGDFLEIEYTARSASDDRIVSTTDKAKAEAAGIYNKSNDYGPVLVILGSNGVIKGLDTALRAMSLSETKKFTFKPQEAFGERNEDLVRVMPLSDFKKRDIVPYPGMQVNLDNVTAMVRSVNSGRVVVDANHPMAGKELEYEVKVVSNLTTDESKVNALGKTYGAKPDSVAVKDKTVVVNYGDAFAKNADYFVGKANMIAALFTYVKSIDAVKVEEDYKRPQEQKTAAAEKKPESSAQQ